MTITFLNYVDLAGIVKSLCQVEEQITREVGALLQQSFNVEARPYGRYESAVYPKWLNSLTDEKPEDFGIQEDYEPYSILIELQLGKKTQGYDGALEQQLYTWVPYTSAAFRATPRLQVDPNVPGPNGLLTSKCRLFQTVMPEEIIGAKFILSCATFVSNLERD